MEQDKIGKDNNKPADVETTLVAFLEDRNTWELLFRGIMIKNFGMVRI
jgi:hypothetical protein